MAVVAEGSRARRGSVYDNALRLLATVDVAALCRWLGVEVGGDPERLSEALPARTQHADLIVRVGEGRLVRVEFVRRPDATLPLRMLEYRARIMRREPGHTLVQHVVVLAEGSVPGWLLDGADLARRLNVVYLRDRPPEEFLDDPALAPRAVLARPGGRWPGPVDLLREVLGLLAALDDPERRAGLTEAASVLAAIRLDDVTIERTGREIGMPITLEGTIGGRSLEKRLRAKLTEEIRAEVTEEVRAMLATVLRRTFGDDPRIPQAVVRLAALGPAAAVERALTATSLDALLADG